MYALLEAIADSESAGAWNVIYGGQTFDDFSEHPRQYVTINSGPNKGKLSSAAGKYQITATTYDRVAPLLGITDFSPESQMQIAAYLADEAYPGDLDAALNSADPEVVKGVGRALNGVWTSLPGGIEQGQSSDQFLSNYTDAVERRGDLVPPLNIGGEPAPIPATKPGSVSMAQRLSGGNGDVVEQLKQRLDAKAAAISPEKHDVLADLRERIRPQMEMRQMLREAPVGLDYTAQLPDGYVLGDDSTGAPIVPQIPMDVSSVDARDLVLTGGVGSVLGPGPSPSTPNPIRPSLADLTFPGPLSFPSMALARGANGLGAAANAQAPATKAPVPMPRDARPVSTPSVVPPDAAYGPQTATVGVERNGQLVPADGGPQVTIGQTYDLPGGARTAVLDVQTGLAKLVKPNQVEKEQRDQQRAAIADFGRKNLGLDDFSSSVFAELPEDTPYGNLARSQAAPMVASAIAQAANAAQSGIKDAVQSGFAAGRDTVSGIANTVAQLFAPKPSVTPAAPVSANQNLTDARAEQRVVTRAPVEAPVAAPVVKSPAIAAGAVAAAPAASVVAKPAAVAPTPTAPLAAPGAGLTAAQRNAMSSLAGTGLSTVAPIAPAPTAIVAPVQAVQPITVTRTPKTTEKITGDSYTVRSGDTLSSIAARSGMTVQQLAAANGIANPNNIQAGQTIKLSSTSSNTSAPVAAPKASSSSSSSSSSGVPAGYTDLGGGKFQSESGGIYYTRNL